MGRVRWTTRSILATTLLVIALSGCAKFRVLRKEVDKLQGSYTLKGRLVSKLLPGATVYVAVWEKDDFGVITIIDVSKLNAGGTFAFLAPPGDHYYVGALEDLNQNGKKDPGERIWFHGDPSPIEFQSRLQSGSDREVKGSELLEIELSSTLRLPEADDAALERAVEGKSFVDLKNYYDVPIFIGKQADLDDPKFSPKNGSKGLWQPASFLAESGVGVYFVDDYSSRKVPVLFVHGAGGSPQDHRELLDRLNKWKYQPWIYHYPSGVRLDSAAAVLDHIIDKLHEEHEFEELYVVAHSMGGLVSRSFIGKNRIEGGNGYVKKFVSISTPWNGHEAAAFGVKYAPTAVPSWYDMKRDSQFIRETLEMPLGSGFEHYLIFGYIGGNPDRAKATDGTVSVTSQRDPRAVQAAKVEAGYPLDHMAILKDDGVIERVDSMLDGKE